MSLQDHAVPLGGGLLAALLLSLAWVVPVFAEVGDTDGLDAEELVLPLALAVVIAVGAVAYWRYRRSQSRQG